MTFRRFDMLVAAFTTTINVGVWSGALEMPWDWRSQKQHR